MAWLNMLYRTYEANAEMAGVPTDSVPLTLVAHITANAQVEITVDKDGNFVSAAAVTKENGKTVIPVTESSAARANVIAPHSLCDMLAYTAGDFGDYVGERKKSDEKFDKYISALEKWVNSEYSHPKARAVYLYAAKKCMMSDLINSGLVELNEDGTLSDKKISGAPYEKALVRFRVQGTEPDAVWQDKSLFDSYTAYYVSGMPGDTDICYISGRSSPASRNHPKGILAAYYNAKLISANDSSNFTYRGRFTDSNQAYAISYEATQKAHSALTWLAANQGVYAGKRTYICWNPNGREVAGIVDPLGLERDEEPKAYTEAEYKKRLIDTLNGYRGKIDDNDDIVVIGLDAATTGRLSVVYYNELKKSDFYDRLERWFNTFEWYYVRFTQDKKALRTVMTPLTMTVVNCAFGTEQGGLLKTDDRIYKEQYQRILHCMLDAQPLPYDIVHALVSRATNPQLYDRWYNYESVLSTACAAIAKHNYDKRSVETAMELDYKNNNRSYLFGRLLAVLEKVEQATYEGETRETNAIRLMSAYVNHPMSTWKILDTALNPYFQQLSPGQRYYYKNMISDIAASFDSADENMLNRPLDEDYLIGYYLQRRELNKKKEDKQL